MAKNAPHHHPPPANSEEAAQPGGRPYSLFMHHAAGYGLLLVGTLTLLDRATSRRYPALRYGVGLTWILIGLFIFIRADPEGWPMGRVGFMESWTMPTAFEWLQHKVLALVPICLGIYALFVIKASGESNRTANYALAVMAVVGAIGLMSHQHQDHPGMDLVNVQHRMFALTALLTALSLVQEMWRGWRWVWKELFYPSCLIVLGLQLVIYTE